MPDLDTLPEGDGKTSESDFGRSTSTETTRTSDLENQFAEDKQPGGNTGGFASGQQFARSNKLVGRFKKLKRYQQVIGALVAFSALIAPFVLFFLFLFLFKLNHIKQLFIDYRFAKFDRVVSERLRAAIDEAKSIEAGEPGKAPAAKDAPLQEQLAQAKADGLPDDVTAKETADLELKTKSYMESDLAGSPGGEIDDRFKIESRDVTAVDETKPKTEIDAAVEKDLESKIDDPGKGPEAVPEGELRDAIDEAKNDVKTGTDPVVATEKVSTKLLRGGTEALNIAGKVTIACMLVDIWGGARKAYIAYKAGGLVKAAESIYSWADAQKQGKANLEALGVVAGKFDNEKESFINSAGAQQAAGQPITGPPLTPETKPIPAPPIDHPLTGALDFFTKIPGIEKACAAILKPGVQLGVAAASIVAILVAAAVGTPVSAAAIVSAIVVGVGTFFGGIAGKALMTDIVAHAAHTAISSHASPLAWGNYMSGGTKIMADNSCFAVGCTQLTPTQAAQLNSTIRKEQIAAAKKRGLAYRFIATSNPRSVLSQTLFALPSSPSAMFGRMNQFFASILNPAKLAFTGSKLAISTASSNTAYAEESTDYVTGQAFVGVPIGTKRWPIRENDNYVRANLSTLKSKYGKCFEFSAEDYATRIDEGPGRSECDNIQGNDDALRYYQYNADHRVIHGVMLLKNKHPLETASGGSAGGTAGGTIDLNTVYQPSDNVACASGTTAIERPATGYHNSAPIQIKLCALPSLNSSSDESTPGSRYYIDGANGLALSNSRASGAFLALANAIKASGLPMTATSTFRTMQHQQDLFNGDSGGAEVAVPGTSNHQMGLAIDFSCNGSLVSRGDTCFTWLEQNAGKYGISNYPKEAWHWSVDGH